MDETVLVSGLVLTSSIAATAKSYVEGAATATAVANATARGVLVSGWDTTASLPTAKGYAPVFIINNKLYHVNGYTQSGATNATVMYDPVTHTWSTKATVSEYQYSGAGGTINGLGYIMGGYNYGSSNYGYVSQYNPTTNQWTYRGSMQTAVLNCVGVSFPLNNRIYIFGGNTGIQWHQPTTNTNGYVGLKTVYNGAQATLGTDNWIYVCGGETTRTDHFKYNPLTNVVTDLAPLPVGRYWHQYTQYKGLNYIIAGHAAGQNNTTSVIAYDPITNTYSSKVNLPTGVAHHSGGVITEDGQERLFVVGGHNGSAYVNTVYRGTAKEVDVSAAFVAKATVQTFASAKSNGVGIATLTADATVTFGESFDAGMVELTGVARPQGTYPDSLPVATSTTLSTPGITMMPNAKTIATKVRGLRLQPGDNDDFANAEPIFGSSGSINGITTGRTMEVGEPEPLPGYDYTRGSWYRWTAPSTGEFRFTTLGSAAAYGYADLIVAAYTGTNFGNLVTVAYSDEAPEYEGAPWDADGLDENEPTVSFYATSGTQYYLVVGAWGTNVNYDKEFELSWEEVPASVNLLQASFALIPEGHGWHEEWMEMNLEFPATITRSTSFLSRQGNPTIEVTVGGGQRLQGLTHAPINVTPGETYTFAFDGMFTLPETNGWFAVDMYFYDSREPAWGNSGWSNVMYRWTTPDDQGWGYGHGAAQETWFREYTTAIAPSWATMMKVMIYTGNAESGAVFRMGDPSLRVGFGREFTLPQTQHATVTEACVIDAYRSQWGALTVENFRLHGRVMRAWIPDPFNWGANPYHEQPGHMEVITS